VAESGKQAFNATLSLAIDDLLEHGFDSEERVREWQRKLRAAAAESLVPEYVIKRQVDDALVRVYKRWVENPTTLRRRHHGVSMFTLQNVKPKLRAELDRRILASANLIKLNREASIERTLQRFAGWSTSIPIGGTDLQKRKAVKDEVRRGISGLPFEERRVVIDQGHKLVSAVNHIVAKDGGAIAGIWRHVHMGPPAYQSRPAHVARDGEYFLIRDSWAAEQGLVKTRGVTFTVDIEQPGELIFCGCHYEYVYAIGDLPRELLTAKGVEELDRVRRIIRSA